MSQPLARPLVVAILGVAGACAACFDAADGDPSRIVTPSAGARPIGGCPGYGDPDHCPPFPTGGPGVLRGVVLERTTEGRRPLAGIEFWPWVNKNDGSSYSHRSVVSDSAGRFVVDELPDGSVQLFAGGKDFDQPCTAIAAVGDTARRDTIELVRRSRPDPSLAAVAPILSGVVYEATSAGRRPVAGARVYLETSMGLLAAVTTTDERGRYALCRLPTATHSLSATRDGRTSMYFTVTISGDTTTLDVELAR